MGVNTTADEKRDSAINHIKDAIKDISCIVIDECWGYDDFTKDFKNELFQAMNTLHEIKDRIGYGKI